MRNLLRKICRIFNREADYAIGGRENPYMLRWFVIPRNPLFNIYLHKFLRDDDDRAMHDHPWWFATIMLRGSYKEWRLGHKWNHQVVIPEITTRRAPSIAFRRATSQHRIELLRDKFGNSIPCWTLVFTGPRIREWGFHCPQGWRHWKEFTAGKDGELVGRGCD